MSPGPYRGAAKATTDMCVTESVTEFDGTMKSTDWRALPMVPVARWFCLLSPTWLVWRWMSVFASGVQSRGTRVVL